MKKQFSILVCAALAAGLSSCNDYMDLEPITSVPTTKYLYAENDLAAYATQFYEGQLPSHGRGGYNLGLFAQDNGTDNQVAATPSTLFVTGQSHTGDWSTWSSCFTNIRSVNYFLETVPERYENGEISGADANIRHYIGEMYFFRAMIYYTALKNLGDFPILETQLSDDYEVVREASRRRPRNEVARFIIADLDRAYDLMLATAPMSNRLNRDCAALLKSRVALFEGTWEKYHRGTARVPGGPGWPGANADYLSDYSISIDTEIKYFLGEAMSAAQLVAANHSLSADYSAIFNSISLAGNDEVLLWRQYSTAADNNVYHFVVSYLQRNGSGNTGYTRSMVDSYLMADGTPIYASASYQGDDSYEHLFAGRDPRMDMCILKPGDLIAEAPNFAYYVRTDGRGYYIYAPIFQGNAEDANPTGYSLRKGLNTAADMATTKESYTACPVFRAAEAYLNYIEACYELNGSLDDKAASYWRAIRSRAGLDTDYNHTIAATVMANEKLDWGSYSAGSQIDATLYNIRRERRIELVSEGFRLDDLKRWRALDQVSNFHVQGFNFWDGICNLYTNPSAPDALSLPSAVTLVPYGSSTGTPNVSAKDDPYAEGRYFLPFRKNSANIGFNGLNWNQVKYLVPISNKEFRLTTEVQGSDDYSSSTIYQNPGWSVNDGTLPEGD